MQIITLEEIIPNNMDSQFNKELVNLEQLYNKTTIDIENTDNLDVKKYKISTSKSLHKNVPKPNINHNEIIIDVNESLEAFLTQNNNNQKKNLIGKQKNLIDIEKESKRKRKNNDNSDLVNNIVKKL